MENLSINLSRQTGLMPPIIRHLASIPEDGFSYRYYQLRHPGGIFNIQFRNFCEEFIRTLDELKKSEEFGNSLELLRHYTHLLFSFQNYYEASYEIMLAVCKPHNYPDKKKFLYKWLKNNNYQIGQKFYTATKEDTWFFREIFNELKHKSNRFWGLNFCKDREIKKSSDYIIGYYLQSIDSTGSLGSNTKFHPMIDGRGTANSFNRDLRILYYCAYKVAEELLVGLKEHFLEVYNVELIENPLYKSNDQIYSKLYEMINKLSQLYFPLELNKITPYPKLTRVNNQQELTFSIKNNHEQDYFDYRVEANMAGDGFSRKFKLIYMKPEVNL